MSEGANRTAAPGSLKWGISPLAASLYTRRQLTPRRVATSWAVIRSLTMGVEQVVTPTSLGGYHGYSHRSEINCRALPIGLLPSEHERCPQRPSAPFDWGRPWREKTPTRKCRGFSLLNPWLPATRKTQDMSGCQPRRPRTGANRCDGENLQAVECHLDHAPTRVPPSTFDRNELRQMIFQLVGLAAAALARCVGPYLSSLPRFLDCRALPTRPGSAVPTFSHELLRWICRRAMDTEVSPEGPPLPRVGGTRFQSSPLLPGSVITLSD